MEVQENNITKLCSFYVSDWHLVTMILPYINQKINEQAEIATILEKDIEEKVNILVEKLNLKNKEKILNLNWKKTKENTVSQIKKEKEQIILIEGSNEFIQKANKQLIKKLKEKGAKNKIKIINCYEITEKIEKITEILDKHDKVLNTSGEKEIKEVFSDYETERKPISVLK